jgi:succinate-semialdehyde dehydrogenase/glutarate-semialdehyde dehydrogenase
MDTIDPSTGELIASYDEHDSAEVERRLAAAAAGYAYWRQTSPDTRAEGVSSAAAVLRQQRQELAGQMTLEMGKPIAEAEAEIDKCAWVCDFYAENGAGFLAPEPIATDATESFVRYDPIGAVLAVMPWNFPFWQVFRFAAPALVAGNVGLLKHASNVPGCALAIEKVFQQAGLPKGVFTTLLVPSRIVPRLIADPKVAAVTLTGSEQAGEDVACEAGRQLKKTVLELGGSDPFIVLADADVGRAVAAATTARTINSGQSCIAAKRFIVEEPIADEFAAAMARRMAALVVGDPSDRKTQVGPLARRDLVEELDDQVRRTEEKGADLLTGGAPLDRPGFYYAPTVLGDVEPGMAVFEEETFGPVAAVVRAADREHAVKLANLSAYGLGAAVWTADAVAGRELAVEIEAGCVFVNGIVKSDPRLPFGGVKRSGYGRELARQGIREFVNVKTVWVG